MIHSQDTMENFPITHKIVFHSFFWGICYCSTMTSLRVILTTVLNSTTIKHKLSSIITTMPLFSLPLLLTQCHTTVYSERFKKGANVIKIPRIFLSLIFSTHSTCPKWPFFNTDKWERNSLERISMKELFLSDGVNDKDRFVRKSFSHFF